MATSRSLNKVMIIGNLSRDPVLRTTPTGATVGTFGIATNTAWRDESGELQERTEFHNVVAWNKLAEICAQILSVGMLVFIEGEMRTRTWDDENGVRHYRSEVRVSDMKLLDSKGKSGVGVDGAKDAGEARSKSKVTTKEEGKEVKEKSSTVSSLSSNDGVSASNGKGDEEKKEENENKVDSADLPF